MVSWFWMWVQPDPSVVRLLVQKPLALSVIRPAQSKNRRYITRDRGWQNWLQMEICECLKFAFGEGSLYLVCHQEVKARTSQETCARRVPLGVLLKRKNSSTFGTKGWICAKFTSDLETVQQKRLTGEDMQLPQTLEKHGGLRTVGIWCLCSIKTLMLLHVCT